VHVLFTHAWLLTVRAGAGNAMDRVHRVFGTFRNEIAANPALGLLIVLDDFIASFHPILDHAEQVLYELEDQILRTPREAQLQQLSTLRHQLTGSYGDVNPGTDGLTARTNSVPRRPAMMNDMCSCPVSTKSVP
jgi:Mg2+ and Co2+ transporter CorA